MKMTKGIIRVSLDNIEDRKTMDDIYATLKTGYDIYVKEDVTDIRIKYGTTMLTVVFDSFLTLDPARIEEKLSHILPKVNNQDISIRFEFDYETVHTHPITKISSYKLLLIMRASGATLYKDFEVLDEVKVKLKDLDRLVYKTRFQLDNSDLLELSKLRTQINDNKIFGEVIKFSCPGFTKDFKILEYLRGEDTNTATMSFVKNINKIKKDMDAEGMIQLLNALFGTNTSDFRIAARTWLMKTSKLDNHLDLTEEKIDSDIRVKFKNRLLALAFLIAHRGYGYQFLTEVVDVDRNIKDHIDTITEIYSRHKEYKLVHSE